MRTADVFAFLVLSALGTATVLWALRLYRAYRRPFLMSYALHLAFWSAHALVQVTYFILGRDLLARGVADSLGVLLWPLFVLLMGLSFYFFMVATAGLCERSIPPIFRAVYLALWGGTILIQAVSLGRSGTAATGSLLGSSSILAAVLKIGTVLGCMLWLVLAPGHGEDPSERRFRTVFAGTYLAGFTLFQFSARRTIPLDLLPFPDYIIGLVQFGFQIPPLLILSGFLRRQPVFRPPDVSAAELDERMASLGLSAREAEIAGLVLRGRSNREIGKELFISLETVKKHVSNIYRKLGVRNRVQLGNVIRNRYGAGTVDRTG